MDFPDLPEWERLLWAERHLQGIVPGAVLVGGTAAALHAGHRRSLDGDHVLEDLRLAAAAPSDAPSLDLRSYKGLSAPWNDWSHLAARGRHWAGAPAAGLLGRGAP